MTRSKMIVWKEIARCKNRKDPIEYTVWKRLYSGLLFSNIMTEVKINFGTTVQRLY